jgi:hypothetical protein
MNLFNGVFGKSSAFSKVNGDHSTESQFRHRRSMDLSSNMHSSSSNPSVEGRRSFVHSSDRNSSSSERDMSMNSDNVGSCDRAKYSHESPWMTPGNILLRPKPIKPTPNSNFGFLSNWNMNGINRFGVNSNFYWMKYQMLMKQHSGIGNFRNLAAVNSPDLPNSPHNCSLSDEEEKVEKMIGNLTEGERRMKVERYLQKKRKRSKMVRYEWRKSLAQKRLRYQGRFISEKEAEKFDQGLIYNPNNKLVPKPIFHTVKDTEKWRRKCGHPKLLNSSIDSLESKGSINSEWIDNKAGYKSFPKLQKEHPSDWMDVDVSYTNKHSSEHI